MDGIMAGFPFTDSAIKDAATRFVEAYRARTSVHTGYENLSAFVPIEIDDIERLMAQPGLSDAALQIPVR
jgi:hypothetical protein